MKREGFLSTYNLQCIECAHLCPVRSGRPPQARFGTVPSAAGHPMPGAVTPSARPW